ncbi:FIST signal transduction protein [Noviherbaspirillum sp.]|uniref:FIST signal transduction protein n=1 Tax=Noviherbaspirillum sp. TaxID=1926288 RepID=UPI002B489662|nr:FIST N-terminal domain-containing protein [Noviherbaspirillum sp.]HJV82635.1 FIST N-terminal domain-containing protein [Noviherbaspirillum sp.]
MELSTFSFQAGRGWSLDAFPALDSPRTLLMVFAAPEYMDAPSPIAELLSAYPQSHFIGCSTAGEIFGPLVGDRSLSVAALRFEHSRIASVSACIEDASESRSAAERLAMQLDPSGLRAVFVLSDGLNVNGSELVKGLNGALPADVIVTGGLAGDGDRFKRTWVLSDGRPQSGIITAVGLYGDRLRVTHGSRGGWDSFGPERRVTRSNANILYELDGKPALELYKEYLGERASGLPATGLLFPLSIRKDANNSRQVVRTILGVDESNQALIFAGDVPKGYLAQLMRANFDRLVNGASVAADQARGGPVAGPVLATAISCVGRRLVLGERVEEETESTLENLPAATQQIGFYSYGEISPYTTGSCDLHNQTMTLTTFAET